METKNIGRNFVTGDTHGKTDIQNINKWYNKTHQTMTKADNLFILGDWGAIWYYPSDRHKYKKDVELQVKWTKKKYQTIVILGNHENYTMVNKLPIIEKWGGKVRVLKPKNPYTNTDYGEIYILERGEIYTINGEKILALGGAKSQDAVFRTLGEDYWKEELWSEKEKENCLLNLENNNWKVDFVFAHTCPDFVGNYILQYELKNDNNTYRYEAKSKDPLSVFYTTLIKQGLTFKEWHFGHWHDDLEILNFVDENDNFKYMLHYNKAPYEVKK